MERKLQTSDGSPHFPLYSPFLADKASPALFWHSTDNTLNIRREEGVDYIFQSGFKVMGQSALVSRRHLDKDKLSRPRYIGHATRAYEILYPFMTILYRRFLLRLKTISKATTPIPRIIRCLVVWIFKQENASIKEDEIVDQKYWNLPIEFLEVAPSAPSPLDEAGLASRHFWYLWKIKLSIYRNDIIALLTSVCTQPRWSYTRAPL